MSKHGNFARAEALIREAVFVGDKAVEKDSPNFACLLSKLGDRLLEQEKSAELSRFCASA